MGWNAHWLQSSLRRHFVGERLIVVSNREPCVHDLAADGSIVERHPVSQDVNRRFADAVIREAGSRRSVIFVHD